MTAATALSDLAAAEAALYRMRCHLNSMAAADARALLEEATEA